MIKYLGSKRRLVPVLARICEASGARTALDLFTGTTRVAQAFKTQGVHVTAADSARYAHAFARTYIEADADATDVEALRGGRHPPQRAPRQAGLRARDVQPSGPVLPTAQRRPDRCRAGRHRLGLCGVTPVPPAAHEPHRGRGPGRFDHRRADGVREAVGPPVVQPARAAGAGAARGSGPRRPGRCGRPRADAGSLRPGLPRSAVQPAPVFHQLPRLGDAGGLGRARGLRRGPQAGGRPRPVHAFGVQLEADHARRPGLGGPIRGL